MVEDAVSCPEKNDILRRQIPDETIGFGVDVLPYRQVDVRRDKGNHSCSLRLIDGNGAWKKDGLKKSLKAIRRIGIGPSSENSRPELPVATPEPGTTISFIRSELALFTEFRLLKDALESDTCPDPRTELESILKDLYTLLDRHGLLVLLLDGSAQDWPDLAEIIHTDLIGKYKSLLTRYIARRMKSGHFRTASEPEAVTWLITETTVWFAVRRRHTGGHRITDHAARETLLDSMLRSLLP